MVLWTLAVGLILIIWLFKLNKNFHVLAFFAPRIKTVNGSPVENIVSHLPGTTIFGNTFDVANLDYGKLQLEIIPLHNVFKNSVFQLEHLTICVKMLLK